MTGYVRYYLKYSNIYIINNIVSFRYEYGDLSLSNLSENDGDSLIARHSVIALNAVNWSA